MQLYGAGNEFCERLAFYGLATNLVIYLQTVMGADPASAATNLMVFEGTCYLTPLLGAWLADSLWGRYKTILVFSVIYMFVSPLARGPCTLRFGSAPKVLAKCMLKYGIWITMG